MLKSLKTLVVAFALAVGIATAPAPYAQDSLGSQGPMMGGPGSMMGGGNMMGMMNMMGQMSEMMERCNKMMQSMGLERPSDQWRTDKGPQKNG